MVRNLQVNNLLFSDLLVKEAVDDVNEEITDINVRKIILASGRGTGKSVILGKRELDSLKSKDLAILTRFDAVGIFGTKDNKYFNKKVMEHYYEVIMAKKLLNYIKEYYPDLYYRECSRLDGVVSEKIFEVDRYINDAFYKDSLLNQPLFSGEIVSYIVSILRRGTKASSLTLMMDRFDWVHNSDPRVQNILKKYFDMFEKVIITSDDSTIWSDKRMSQLKGMGFEVVDFSYARDPQVIKKIVEPRFELDEHKLGVKRFPVCDISDEDYSMLVERCDGNISTMLDALCEAESIYQWAGSNFSMTAAIDSGCTDRIRSSKQLRKISKPQKLHL